MNGNQQSATGQAVLPAAQPSTPNLLDRILAFLKSPFQPGGVKSVTTSATTYVKGHKKATAYALVAIILVVAYWTNPGFKSQTWYSLGVKAPVAGSAWFTVRDFFWPSARPQVSNYYVFSIATYNGETYVGAFKTWIPLNVTKVHLTPGS